MDEKGISIQHKGQSVNFQFDRVWGMDTTQRQVFDEVSQLVQSALDGYNVCLMSYGQTGSGKTYTMQGDMITSDMTGIIPRAITKIMEASTKLREEVRRFTILPIHFFSLCILHEACLCCLCVSNDNTHRVEKNAICVSLYNHSLLSLRNPCHDVIYFTGLGVHHESILP